MQGLIPKKYIYVLVGALFTSFLVILFILPKLPDTVVIKSLIEREIKKATNFDIEIKGRIKLSFFPSISIKCEDIYQNKDSASFIFRIKKLVIYPALYPLIKGILDIRKIKIEAPDVSFSTYTSIGKKLSPDPSWPTSESNLQPIHHKLIFRNIEVEQGKLCLRHGLEEWHFKNIFMEIPVISFEESNNLKGSFRYKSSTINFRINSGSFKTFFEGKDLPLTLNIEESNGFAISLNCVLRRSSGGFYFSVKGDGNIIDLKALGRLLNLDLEKLSNDKVLFSFEWESDNESQRFDGTVENSGQKIFLSGLYNPSKRSGGLKVTSEVLDLSSIFSGKLNGGPGKDREEEILLKGKEKVAKGAEGISLELEADLKELRYKEIGLKGVRFLGIYERGQIFIRSLTFSSFGGFNIIRGRVDTEKEEFQGELFGQNLKLEELLNTAQGTKEISGLVNGKILIDSLRIKEPSRSLKAEGNLTIKNGVIKGSKKLMQLVNLIGLISRYESRDPLSYEIEEVKFKVIGEDISITQGKLFSELGEAYFYGDISLSSRSIAMIVHPVKLKFTDKGSLMNLKVHGTFDSINVAPQFRDVNLEKLKEFISPLKRKLNRS